MADPQPITVDPSNLDVFAAWDGGDGDTGRSTRTTSSGACNATTTRSSAGRDHPDRSCARRRLWERFDGAARRPRRVRGHVLGVDLPYGCSNRRACALP